MRRLPRLQLREGDRELLEARASSDQLPPRVVQRARIVLLAAEGVSNSDISLEVGMHWNRVAVWRRRYAAEGLTGLEDGSRSGRPPVYGLDDLALMLQILSGEPPAPRSRWTVEGLAARMTACGVPISSSQVWRICTSLDLPLRERPGSSLVARAVSWTRVTDVVGIWLARDAAACVLSLGDGPVVDAATALLHAESTGEPPPGSRSGLDGLLRHVGDAVSPASEATRCVPSLPLGHFLAELRDRVPSRVALHCILEGRAPLERPPGLEFHESTSRRSWLASSSLLVALAERALHADGRLGRDEQPAATLNAALRDLVKSGSFEWRISGYAAVAERC